MLSIDRYADYDLFAQFYNQYWGSSYSERTFPVFEKLLLQRLPAGAHILELGCGTGHLAQKFIRQGYQVTGVDGSAAMIHYAKQNAPEGAWMTKDVRHFASPPAFHAAASTGTFNHIMSLEELTTIFHQVYAALLANGWFVFDLILHERFQQVWNGALDGGDVQDTYAWASRSSYDPGAKTGANHITLFQLQGEDWQRSDITWPVSSYSTTEVQAALEQVGFVDLCFYDSEQDLNVSGDANVIYWVCRKPNLH
jgi:cyclopropane fatty-acyl-phospholipid synthase-like methyltransferase